MSAFIVDDKVINGIVRYLATAIRHGSFEYHEVVAREYMVDMSDEAEVKAMAEQMFALNVRAVEARYGKGEADSFRPLGFTYNPPALPPTPIQAYKWLQCWRYQCSEGDVPSSGLYKAMGKVLSAIAHNIVQRLPAYDKAEW